jgi:CHAD domain-containing protein
MTPGFELQHDETPFAALSRIVTGQMVATAAGLRDRTIDVSERVHESRKRFKETRALLRLFREPIGREQFTAENLWYRDAGRELAEYRDADAIVSAVDNLPAKVRRELGPTIMRRLRRMTRNEHRAIYDDQATAEARIESIAAMLPAAAARLDNVRSRTFDGFASIEPGLSRSLRAGRRAMREAYESRDPLAFHEWRKRVKDHWYHVQLIRPMWPEKLAGRRLLLETLSHILGEHHDLEVIRDLVTTSEDVFGPEEIDRIARTLTARQHRLERKAESAGKKIYRKRAKEFAARVGKRWKKWKTGQ